MSSSKAKLLLACLALLFAGVASAELVVIVNARSGVAAMTRNEVINIFFGRYRQFFNGVEAKPIDLVDGQPERASFYSALVGKDLADVDAYWSRQVFSGHTKPPARAANADEVIKWEATQPGGIGFVDLVKADARVRVVYEFKP